ncbi:MAG: PilZ domain-containing protein [Cystobacterineae bacterium]|nr:PilZ domain-containing protein [Cystobacterineae bacterium]
MVRENERRSEERATTKLEVRFENAKEAARIFKTYSLNLSPSGICIRNTQHLFPGERIRLSLVVGGQKFALRGRIAWAREDVVGLRFEGVSPEEKRRLKAAIWPSKNEFEEGYLKGQSEEWPEVD